LREGAVTETVTSANEPAISHVLPVARSTADSPTVESTVANLIQAMASFNTGRGGQSALFDSVSGGVLHEDTALAQNHRSAVNHP